MEHNKILKWFKEDDIVSTLNEEITFLIIRARAYAKRDKDLNISQYVASNLFERWNNIELLNSDKYKFYKLKIYFIVGVLFHKYGLVDETVTNKAIKALKTLDDNVVTCDKMSKEVPNIIKLLKAKPVELKRNPRNTRSKYTNYRENDIIAIRLNNMFYVAYVHKIRYNAPIIEFYEVLFNHLPKLSEIKDIKARGFTYQNQEPTIKKYMLDLAIRIPDFANQIHLIGNDQNLKLIPDNSHLTQSIGLYSVADVFNIKIIAKIE